MSARTRDSIYPLHFLISYVLHRLSTIVTQLLPFSRVGKWTRLTINGEATGGSCRKRGQVSGSCIGIGGSRPTLRDSEHSSPRWHLNAVSARDGYGEDIAQETVAEAYYLLAELFFSGRTMKGPACWVPIQLSTEICHCRVSKYTVLGLGSCCCGWANSSTLTGRLPLDLCDVRPFAWSPLRGTSDAISFLERRSEWAYTLRSRPLHGDGDSWWVNLNLENHALLNELGVC